MATWGSIRIPYFTSENRSSAQHELPIDSARGLSSCLKSFTGVKKDPFPASLLKAKAQELPKNSTAASRSCGAQLHDLTRRTCHKISSYATPCQTYGAFRRTRSERKQDWDMAMSWLMHGWDFPVKDETHGTSEAIQFPVLETILLEEDGAPRICFAEVPVMLLISPVKRASVLSIESNICFDAEFLTNVCKGLHGVQIHHRDWGNLAFVERFWIPKEACSKKLVDPNLRQETKAPIMTSSALHNSRLFKQSIHEILQTSILPVHDKLGSNAEGSTAQGSLDEALKMMKLNHLEVFRVSFQERVQLANNSLRIFSDRPFHSDTFSGDNLLHNSLLDKVDVNQRNRSARNIHGPILKSKLLVMNHKGNEGKSILMELTPIRGSPNLCSIDMFQSLAEFCRNPFTSEKCLWSKASKGVMSRARYKRKRLLLPRTRILPLILSSGQCSMRLEASSKVEAKLEELDSLVFSRLRAISVHIDRNKSRNSLLLDSLDFVAEHVAKRRREFLTTCYRAVLKTIHEFDPPARKWSTVHFEKIRSRYEGPRLRSPLPGETSPQKINAAEVIDVDSDESALEDFLLSDDDAEEQTMDANGFGMLEEIRADLRQHTQQSSKPNRPLGNAREGPSADMHDFGKETRNKSKVRLRVPDGLVCAPWVIEVANQCLQTMARGSIFVPPPLSALPVVSMLTNSHLKHNVRDQRVVIICESDTNVTDYIRECLQRSLGESVSVDTINKGDHDGGEGIAVLPHTTARVVILDSFSFSFTIPFSLLVVFIARPKHMVLTYSHLREQAFESDVSSWSRIPAVILAPLEAGLQSCAKRMRYLSRELKVKNVLWVKATEAVRDSITISTPRAIYLAPSQQAAGILALLDAHAKPCIETYLNLDSVEAGPTVEKTLGLKIVNLRLVQEAMKDSPTEDMAGKHQRLELLYILRQARSFAIYDGFHIAVAYLQHCRRQSDGHVGVLKRILEGLDEGVAKEMAHASHPILKPLRKALKEMKRAMLQDPPSLRSIHRRDSFRPLIIANSQETVDACQRGLPDTALLPDATERNVAVCSVEWFRNASKQIRKSNLRETLEAFSHVFHVIDDRYDVPSDLLLPPALLQQVHAGRTRLITIVVDETRELEGIRELEKAWYHALTTKLEKEEFGDIEYKASYLQQVSLESFWSAARSVLPNCVDETTEHIQTSIPQGHSFGTARRAVTTARKPKAVHLAPREICAFTVQGLRAMLVGRLKSLPKESTGLEINLNVLPGESCSPAATYLHSAIAGNEILRKNVLIKTTFSF